MKTIGNVQAEANSEVFAVASGAIGTDKTCVVNSDGTVSVVAGTAAGLGSAVVVNASFFSTAAAFDSNSNKVVIAYRDDGNGRVGTAVVGTVSGTSISFGSEVVFGASGGSEARPHGMTFDSNSNKIVISFTQGTTKAVVGTVSGTSISFGTAAALSNNGINNTATFDSNSNKVVLAFYDSDNSDAGTAAVATVSGTSISFGTAVVFDSSRTDWTDITFDSNSNKVVICYKDKGNSSYGTAIVGTVSGTNISFGTAAVFHSTVANAQVITFDSNSNKVVIAYQDASNSNYGTAVVGTVSSTSISFGTPVVFESAAIGGANQEIAIVFDSNANNVVISYKDAGNSNYGTYIIGTVSNTAISFGSAAVFNSATTDYFVSAFDSNSNKVVFGYGNGASPNAVTAIVYSGPSSNVTTENFIGISNAAYADTQTATIQAGGAVNTGQSSLTIGQQYFVQGDGTLGLSADDPSVIAGTAVSATDIIVKG